MHRLSKSFAESLDLQLANFEFATFPEAIFAYGRKREIETQGVELVPKPDEAY